MGIAMSRVDSVKASEVEVTPWAVSDGGAEDHPAIAASRTPL
jgi:hypothetical protein